jgi:hypothetical protein
MNRHVFKSPCIAAPQMLVAMLAIAAAAQLLAAPSAEAAIIPAGQPVSLANLIAGDTIVVGDKVFSNFSYTPTLGDMPAAANVTVSGSSMGDKVRLQISGNFHDDPGGGVSDAGLSFDVDVTDPLRYIKGVRLLGTPTTIGDNAQVHIDEAVIVSLPPLPGKDNGLYIEKKVIGGVNSPFNQNSDSLTFQDTTGVIGFQHLTIIKNIFADAGSFEFNSARVTTFIQEFEQTEIPEPATLVLAGLSGIAMIAVARRRR